jgi:hypothetical protein
MALNETMPAEQEDDDFGVLGEAFSRFQEAGLRLPPVPRELIADLDEFSNWYWGSDELNLTDLPGFLDDARKPGGASEVAFGHTGHGVNSWWLCYRVKLDALAVFIRLSYGGVYTDNDAAAAHFNAVAETLESLIPAAEAAQKAGRFQTGHRLIVVLDDLGDSFWEIAGGDGKQHPSADPLADALTFLSQPVLLDMP